MAPLYHKIPPIYNVHSNILILGTFPSVKSREGKFFYNHPQNRFWKVLAAIYECSTPTTITEKKHFLLQNHIAVWDVIESCEIQGSSDSSIKNVIPNNLDIILNAADIKEIYTNGQKAHKLYEAYCQPTTLRSAVSLPSTSPANAAFSLERLTHIWSSLILQSSA